MTETAKLIKSIHENKAKEIQAESGQRRDDVLRYTKIDTLPAAMRKMIRTFERNYRRNEEIKKALQKDGYESPSILQCGGDASTIGRTMKAIDKDRASIYELQAKAINALEAKRITAMTEFGGQPLAKSGDALRRFRTDVESVTL